MDEGAQVFAQQAKAAGVTVNVKILDSGAFYGDQYLKWPFSTDFWGSRNYLAQVAAGSLPSAPYNETHWPPEDPKFVDALQRRRGRRSTQEARTAIMCEMQKMEYDAGGYIIVGLQHPARRLQREGDRASEADKGVLTSNAFGHGYRTIWFG